ncbi:uncharacterized protein LOC123005576 [Tribolium madens]|uniref:uncharacterized protein LOC123005576 n=1 Tax=Tribolium madens TaxID=41895 RepID=UPI001CF76002|nr:uncharacterized protein LOC123005576 [Tribolium madens]
MTQTIIDALENECYLKPDFCDNLKSEVKQKIEDFSEWFNSIARLSFLRCQQEESEILVYLLLNLKKKLKHAISEINKSVSHRKQLFTCNICEETIEVQPWQNVWRVLQDHPHFEESYNQTFDLAYSENESSATTASIIDDLSEDFNQVVLADPEPIKPQENGLNDFKFNFVITYDPIVEETLYPESFTSAAQKRDNISDYTVQKSGAARAVCLLCPCSLISRGRVYKITSYVIKNHTAGQRHLKYASTPVNTTALKQYHEFWRSQEPNFQAHQVHFLPEITVLNILKCHLCQEFVKYTSVIDHIKDKSHKSKLLKIFLSPEGKLNEFYLLDMQVGVYEDVVVNNATPKKDVKPKESKEKNPGQPKCIFVKVLFEPKSLHLPPRYKDHLKFFTYNSELVTCDLCKVNFTNTVVVIWNHISNPQHKTLSGVECPKYKFFCEICNIQIKDENAWNDHFTKGPNRHDSMTQGRKQKVGEYECKTCKDVIFGDELSLSRHTSTRGGRNRAKEVKLPFSVKKLFRTKAFIQEEAERMQIEANKVLENQDKMKQCCDDLERALSGIYPNCKAYSFGSRISGLGNNQSDLDVFMDTGDMYLGERHQDAQSQEQFVKKASKVFKSFKDQFHSVVSIPTARTPIVKIHHIFTNLDCDISFRHGLGVENTKFLRFCMELQPITQSFILLLKQWSDYCRLNEHITNYGLALMAVFFLQTGGFLLSVKTVRAYNPTQSLIIDGWETLNYTVPTEKMKEFVRPYTGNVKQLLRDFFYYYSKFDYANHVVCPLLGNAIPKLFFNERPHELLPIEMKSYVQRIQSENGEQFQFRGLTPFCIQDPFDLSHNLTKACQNGTITRLKALCTLTYELLDIIQ